MVHLYPSLLDAPLTDLPLIIKKLDPLAFGYHIDIMDGQFVHNKGLEIETVNALARETKRPLWIHIMAEKPETYIKQLKVEPGTLISFHEEAEIDIPDTISLIKKKNWLPSLAVSPQTPINKIFPFLNEVAQVLIMSVEPGFGGQSLLKDTLNKIDPLIGYRTTGKLSFRIGFDGGINEKNIKELVKKGVDDIALGSAIFDRENIVEALKLFIQMIKT